MRLPIDKNAFNDFIKQSNIFELTRKSMYQHLSNWYQEAPGEFIDAMRADFDTVVKTYHFFNEIVSFNKNFNFDPPLDTISAIIQISDVEDICCTNYKAIFDYDLKNIDDYLFL